MRWHRSIQATILVLFTGVCFSCESNSNHSGLGGDVPSIEDTPIYGTWAGYFYNDVYTEGDSQSFYDADSSDTFVIGIVTPGEDQKARFIGDVAQYVSDNIAFQDVPGFYLRKAFGCNFSYYTWNTLGLDAPDSYYKADVQSYGFFGNTIFTTALLGGLYWQIGTSENYQFQTYSYNTSGVTANMDNLVGYWRISNSFQTGNSLTFTISKQTENLALITGSDGLNNTFDGKIVIRYNTYSNAPIFSVEDMVMNGLVDLDGLATYIASIDTLGIKVNETMAIGLTDSDASSPIKHLVTGFAEKL